MKAVIGALMPPVMGIVNEAIGHQLTNEIGRTVQPAIDTGCKYIFDLPTTLLIIGSCRGDCNHSQSTCGTKCVQFSDRRHYLLCNGG